MRIVTWNINSIGARLDRVRGFVERLVPDIILLQETKCEDDKFPFATLEELGYQAAVHGQKAYNGVAIVAKKGLTISDVQRGFPNNSEDLAARLVAARVEGLRVVSAYIPNGQEIGSEKFTYKLNWLKWLRAFAAQFAAEEPLLIGGDFNVALGDLDVYDVPAMLGQLHFSDAEREALQDILQLGFVDLVRTHHPDKQVFSWWDYRQLAFARNRGLRIDYLFAMPALAQKCQGAWVERDERKGTKPSDHAPVVADFLI